MGLFDLDNIRNGFFKVHSYEQGLEIFDQGLIKITDVQIDRFTDYKMVEGKVVESGEAQEVYNTTIEVIPKDGSATIGPQCKCSCDYFNQTKEYCEHICAMIQYLQCYRFEDISTEKLDAHESNPQMLGIIDHFRTNLTNQLKQEYVHLRPKIRFDDKCVFVSFVISKISYTGSEIDDLHEFLDLFEHRNKKIYGTSREIVHDINMFDDISRKILYHLFNNRDLIKGGSLVMDPVTFFESASHSNYYEFSYDIDKHHYNRHGILEKKEAPLMIVARQVGDVMRLNTVATINNIHKVGNVYYWNVGKNLNYFYANSNYLDKLLDLLEGQIQLTLQDYHEFKLFVQSAIANKIAIHESVGSDSLNISFAPINVILDYVDEMITIDIQYLQHLINNDFSQNIDYYNLIRIFLLADQIASFDGKLLYVKGLEDIFEFMTQYIMLFKTMGANIKTAANYDMLQVVDITDANLYVDIVDNTAILDYKIIGIDQEEFDTFLKKTRQTTSILKINNKITNIAQELYDDMVQIYHFVSCDKKIKSHFTTDMNRIYQLKYLTDMYDHINLKYSDVCRVKFNELNKLEYKDYQPQDRVNTELRDYQVEGINHILSLFDLGYGAILADEMGLGKTIQALSVAAKIISDGGKVFVVCPTSLTYNWENEATKFLTDQAKILLINGRKDNRIESYHHLDEYNFIISSYDQAKRDLDEINKHEYDLLILDEAQFIKNHSSQNYKSIVSIKSKHKLALTGTPIENGIADLWAICSFIMPNYLSTYNYFMHFFEWPIVYDNSVLKLNVLRKITSPFIIRRLKADVLESLPPKLEEIISIEMNEEQADIYQQYTSKYKAILDDNENITKLELLTMIIRLRQVAIDPRLLDEHNVAGTKIKTIVNLTKQIVASGEKVIIFSQFLTYIEFLVDEFDKAGIKTLLFTGQTSQEQRQLAIDEFNNNDEYQVILITLRAGGTGLNLTAANNVILADPWWNKSVENQATDRAHRLGQTKTVNVYRIITANSIEYKIMRIQDSKSSISASILDPESNELDQLSIEELKQLIKE